jgi:hypothetical protein
VRSRMRCARCRGAEKAETTKARAARAATPASSRAKAQDQVNDECRPRVLRVTERRAGMRVVPLPELR